MKNRFPGRCLAAAGFALALATTAHAARADEAIVPGLTLGGFGTLGAAHSSNDRAEFVRDLSQPGGIAGRWGLKTDTVLGLQANLRLNEQFEGVTQVVSRYNHHGDFTPELMWAFVKFDPTAALSVRAGRLGTEFFMLADSRLVGYSYLTVRPPNDYYGALPFSHIDGADIQATMPLGDGLVRAKAYYGLTREELPLSYRKWDIANSGMGGAYLDYQQGGWQWRVAYAQIRFKQNLPIDDLQAALRSAGATSAAAALTAAGKTSHFWSGGMVYDHGPWQVQAMLNYTDQGSVLFESSRAGYVVAGYRVGEFTPFLGYSRIKSAPKRFSTGLPDLGMLAQLNATVASVLADSHSDQHTISAGVRWDVYRNVALKAQYDAIRGTPTSIFPYRWEKPDWNGKAGIFSLTLDFVF